MVTSVGSVPTPPRGSPDGSLPRRATVGLLRRLVRLFFRRVEVVGTENVPPGGGGLVVAWHPNGVIDGGLILTSFPRPVVFAARHGLFAWPLFGHLLRALDTVPLFRPQDTGSENDPAARREANRRSLDALAGVIAGGSFTCLFPEGESHDLPHLVTVRSGAARLYYRACELRRPGDPPPLIVPAGLHYDHKRLFRSSALVALHSPLALDPSLAEPAADAEAQQRQIDELTAEIERVLHEVVFATESWELHYLMHRVRRIMRAERAAVAGARPGPAPMQERILGFARVHGGYEQVRATSPRAAEQLAERVRHYDERMRALSIADHELDDAPDLASPWRALSLLLQAAVVYLLLPAPLLLGYGVNMPVALALGALARRAAVKRKDEASIKLLAGTLAFPLTWLLLAILAGWGQSSLSAALPQIPEAPFLTAVTTFVLCALGGFLALHYTRLAAETGRSLRVRLTRRRRSRAIAELRRERHEIFTAVSRLSTGLELPGTLAPDGRVIAPEPDALE